MKCDNGVAKGLDCGVKSAIRWRMIFISGGNSNSYLLVFWLHFVWVWLYLNEFWLYLDVFGSFFLALVIFGFIWFYLIVVMAKYIFFYTQCCTLLYFHCD